MHLYICIYLLFVECGAKRIKSIKAAELYRESNTRVAIQAKRGKLNMDSECNRHGRACADIPLLTSGAADGGAVGAASWTLRQRMGMPSALGLTTELPIL